MALTNVGSPRVSINLLMAWTWGMCKEFFFFKSEFTMEVDGPGLSEFFCGNSSQNRPVQIFWNSIPYMYSVYIHC